MRHFAGWAVLAGLVFAASAADAQMLVPYRAVSDFDQPYGQPYGAPPPPPPAYNYGGFKGGVTSPLVSAPRGDSGRGGCGRCAPLGPPPPALRVPTRQGR